MLLAERHLPMPFADARRAPSSARWAAVALTALLASLLPASAAAEDVVVPVAVQAVLLSRVAAYDRAFKERAGDRARVLIVTKTGSPDSQRVAKAMASELFGKTIAGLPVEASVFPLVDPRALASACRAQRIAIVYLAPGLASEVAAVGKALEGIDVLTVAAVPSFVGQGAVLGFDLASGKPQMLVHLAQATAQNVKLSPDVLRLMKVLR
jgi:hypothetical protein